MRLVAELMSLTLSTYRWQPRIRHTYGTHEAAAGMPLDVVYQRPCLAGGYDWLTTSEEDVVDSAQKSH